MTDQLVNQLSARHIPQPRNLIRVPGEQRFAVRGQGRADGRYAGKLADLQIVAVSHTADSGSLLTVMIVLPSGATTNR